MGKYIAEGEVSDLSFFYGRRQWAELNGGENSYSAGNSLTL